MMELFGCMSRKHHVGARGCLARRSDRCALKRSDRAPSANLINDSKTYKKQDFQRVANCCNSIVQIDKYPTSLSKLVVFVPRSFLVGSAHRAFCLLLPHNMGRPILNPSTPINKRRPSSSLRELSTTLHNAAAHLRTASSSARHQRLSAINSAYRDAFRAAVALQSDHGASPSPSSPSSLPSLGLRFSRPRDHDLERLLRRSERLPRLPLPAALRAPMADLAARSAQLVQQRRQLDQASADMRDLHERLLADMERTAQHFVDVHNATGVHGPGPDPLVSSSPRPASRRSLPPGVIRARLRAAAADLPAAFRSAARAARVADQRTAAAQVPPRRPMLHGVRTGPTSPLAMYSILPAGGPDRPTPSAVRVRQFAANVREPTSNGHAPNSGPAESSSGERADQPTGSHGDV